jgi:hypothetical protein
MLQSNRRAENNKLKAKLPFENQCVDKKRSVDKQIGLNVATDFH